MNIKRKKINKYFILSFFLFIFLATPLISFSATTGTNNFESIKFTPQIEFPGTGISGETELSNLPNDDGIISSDLLSKYIKAIYQYGLSIAGILAAVIIMGAGVIWLTSGGDSGKINQAKQYIIGSIVGVFLLFGAYIILNTINPNLIELKPIEVEVTKNIYETITCCHNSQGETIVSVFYNEEIPYVSGGDKDGEMFTGCSSNYNGAKQCAKGAECVRKLESVTTIPGAYGGTQTYNYSYSCSEEAAPEDTVEKIANIKTIICCHPDNKGINIDVTEKDGKQYYANGEKAGQLFIGCDKDTEGVQCVGGSTCIYYRNGVKKYICSNDTYCCSCYKNPILDPRIDYYCTNVGSHDECEKYCEEKSLSDGHGKNYYNDDPYPASLYTCSSSNKCEYSY